MSRRDRRDTRARRAPAPPRPAARGARPALVGGAVLVAAIAVAALVTWGPWRVHAPASPAAAASPADRLDAAAAYQEGARLYTAKRYLEALPYFRRLGVLVAAPPRQLHMQMADVLEHAALESRPDCAQPVTRSSVERVALLRDALGHLDAAERLSSAPRELAEVRAWRANLMRVWGFPWEALYHLRGAAEADPTWTAVAGAADLYTYRLRHPERSVRGIDEDVILRDAP